MKQHTFFAVAALLTLGILTATASAAPLDYRTQASLPVQTGATVKIHLGDEDLDVVVGKQAAVTMAVEVKADDLSREEAIRRYLPAFHASGRDIVIRQPSHHGSNWSLFGMHRLQARVTVTLPGGVDVNFVTGSGDVSFNGDIGAGTLHGRLGSGDTRFDGAASRVDVGSGSGDQHIRLARAIPRVRLHAGSGDIRVRGPAGKLVADTGSGDVIAEELTGAVSMEAGSGDLTARWAHGPTAAAATMTTGSGDVRLYLPVGAQLIGNVESSGDIDSDFPGRLSHSEHSLRFSGPRDAIPVHVRTGSGDVEIRKE